MGYVKLFEEWNGLKKSLQMNDRVVLFQEREIWILHQGVNLGVELDGKGYSFGRPVLIFRKFNQHQFLGIPLTSKEKPQSIGLLLNGISFLKPKSWLNFSQIRVFDAKRLYRRMGKLSHHQFFEAKKTSAQVFNPGLECLVAKSNSIVLVILIFVKNMIREKIWKLL
jgi:mRNA interferase MazF